MFRNLFKTTGLLLLTALAVASFGVAHAQTYPTNSPVYIPNAVLSPVTLSAPGTVSFLSNGRGTLSVRVSGTCTSLAATLQASNDGTNYTAINLYPIATGTSAPTAVASVSAVGFWKANAAGFTSIRFVASALTASCTVAMVGVEQGFNGVSF